MFLLEKKIKELVIKVDQCLFKGNIKFIYRKLKGDHTNYSYQSQHEEFMQDSTLRDKLEQVDPQSVITSKRLDVIVRYLLFRDIAWGKESEIYQSLYCRTILVRTGGNEGQSFYSENKKEGMRRHLEAARELCASMKENGFLKEHYIPIAEDFGLYNGAHRLACAMALNEDVWVRKCGKNGICDMDFKWFCDNGFSLDDKIRILRGFADVHNDCGIFVLYGTAQNRWDYMMSVIHHNFQVVGFVDLDFTTDYRAFEYLIQDIYHNYERGSVISEKIHLLKFSNLILRVVLISDEKFPNKNIYEKIRSVKTDLRTYLDHDYPSSVYITLHGSDSKEEFEDLKQILLSVNNLRHLRMRTQPEVREKFLKMLSDFRSYANKHNISVWDTCIVGSSPLEVVGIRDSTDIDIMVAPELRKVYGDGITHLTSSLDIGTRNYVRNEKEYLISDEQLIYDDECHFMFNGFKFANIEYVLYRKSSSTREKDIRDTKAIHIFFDYYKNFDNKEILQKQIQRELERRGIKRRNHIFGKRF